jgi:CBS domain containing-hemolysin-like protein
MMTLLITSILVVLVVSALCSLTEAALYAVRMPYIRQLAEAGHAAGTVLERFKHNMERPITAILILNTAANTAGAAIAGAQAREILGDASVIWFSACFTVAVLFLSEIIPKVTGVAFNRPLARLLSRPLDLLIKGLFPVVWLTQRIARVIQSSERPRIAPEEEVWHFAALSAEEGSILPFEAELIKNVLQLNDVAAEDVMTPRTVVKRIPSRATVGELKDVAPTWQHTRIPVFDSRDPEKWIGFVLRDDVVNALAADHFDQAVESLCKPIHFVPESAPGHLLLNEFIQHRQHLLGVVDEYGSVVGIVCLEDVIESLLGREIVDEKDEDVDMRVVARRGAEMRLAKGAQDSRSERPANGAS